jgi:excinuclease ABC subunit C
MAQAAAAERYEEAARFRDLFRSIEVTLERQKMVTRGGDADVIGFSRAGNRLEIAILFIRGGIMIGSRAYSLVWELDDAEGLASFLNEYYGREVFIPEELLVPLPLPEHEALAELLSERRGRKVSVNFPRRGVKAELVALATRNAATAAAEREAAAGSAEATLAELQERLHLPSLPRRIECYDISNIGGEHAVGSRVVFTGGRPDTSLYRHYRIRSVPQADDFAMMHEVLARRFRSDRGEDDRPDLIVVDGGIGQLNVLTAVLRELEVTGVAAASLAKSRVAKGMMEEEIERSAERVFLPGRKNPVVLRQNSAPLLLLARIRDEAHRFAITHHKKVRGKAALSSPLAGIAGIGPKRQKALLRRFGSLKRLKDATLEEILAVEGMTRKAAEAVWRELHGE